MRWPRNRWNPWNRPELSNPWREVSCAGVSCTNESLIARLIAWISSREQELHQSPLLLGFPEPQWRSIDRLCNFRTVQVRSNAKALSLPFGDERFGIRGRDCTVSNSWRGILSARSCDGVTNQAWTIGNYIWFYIFFILFVGLGFRV